MQRQLLCAALFAAGLLTACGGGGGGDATVTAPVDTTASVSLTGVASKGLMAGALVTAHAVKADGSVDTAVLAGPVETTANGTYALTFSATKDQPYVIRVAAKADGTTTHLDEVTGVAQPLPAGFTMRTLIVPATTGAITTSANVTPFSEMAVAAAQGAAGGVTVANAAQAISAVTQLLGFNPTTVKPTSVGAASGSAEQQMAIMLTAVSQLAGNGAFGCATGSAGDKVKCVVDKLAQSVSTDSIKLDIVAGGTTTDVSGALAAAVTTVLTTPALSGPVSPATLTTVLANLGCVGAACTAATGGTSTAPTPPSATAVAIAAAKLLFTELKSDFASMFSQGSAASPAAVNAQALKFQAAMKGVQVPAETLVKDAGALLMGIDLYNDFKNGRDTSVDRGRAPGSVASNGSADFSNLSATGCTLYQDSATQVRATAPANAGFIGCSANYYVSRVLTVSGSETTRWRHGFTVTPLADGSFSYATRARRSVETCVAGFCSQSANVAIQTNADGSARAPFAGSVTPTLTNGSITAFTITGELAGAFVQDGNALVNDHHSWDISGTRTIAAFKEESTAFSGNLKAYNADASLAGTLTVKSGSSSEIPVTADGSKPSATVPATQGEIATASLNLVWSTAAAEFEGVLAATDSVWDKSLGYHAPSKVSLSGSLRNIEAGVTNEFIKGVFTATLTGYEAYDAGSSVADSASNFYTVGGSFVGSVTAPNRPKLELTLGASNKSFEKLSELTMQYRSFVNGSPRMVIGINATRAADGSQTLTLSEATSALSMTVSAAATATLLRGGSESVGTLDRNSGVLTFADGSFISLDLGL